MRSTNGPLVAVVAAVSVVAVVVGAAVAAQQGPKSMDGSRIAAPLPGSTASTPGPDESAQPSATPAPTAATMKPTPLATVDPLQTGSPDEVRIALRKLPMGRPPQVSSLAGRVLRGGGGPTVTIPGKQRVAQAVRFGSDILVILELEPGHTELARMGGFGSGFAPQRIADVKSLVTTLDGTRVAYATARWDRGSLQGNAVYWESDVTDRRVLHRPSDWATRVLGVVGDTVYFESDTDQNGTTSTLNEWQSKTGKVTRIKVEGSPRGVNHAGTVVVDDAGGSAQNFCSTVVDIDSLEQQWKTCDYLPRGFTPGDGIVIGTPDLTAGGGDPLIAAIDAHSGKLVRQWTGARFVHAVAEDDKHLLITAYEGTGAGPLGEPPATDSAIIRCAIDTGGCELATKPARTPEARTGDLALIGAWG